LYLLLDWGQMLTILARLYMVNFSVAGQTLHCSQTGSPMEGKDILLLLLWCAAHPKILWDPL